MSKSKPLVPANAVIQDFEIPSFESGIRSYQKIKASFRADVQAQGGGHFILSEHVQSSLSVEKEETRRFEARVAQEVAVLRDAVTKQAWEKGHEAGSAAGRAQAYSEEKSRLAAHMEALATMVSVMAKAKEMLADQYEKLLVNTAYKMAHVIVDREVTDRPASISSTMRSILEKIAKEDDVRIRISGTNFAAIEEIRGELANVTRDGRINFEVDSGLSVGDCIVESQSGEIGSFVKEKIKKLREELNRNYPGFDSGEGGEGEKTGT
jgi:flagellar biosynthesis/type III secretory pathway protein FliH